MPGFGLETQSTVPSYINLVENTFLTREGASKNFDPAHWPVMILMKGIGFEKIKFHNNDSTALQSWVQRIATYQQEYFFDPENFRMEEFQWNEFDET